MKRFGIIACLWAFNACAMPADACKVVRNVPLALSEISINSCIVGKINLNAKEQVDKFAVLELEIRNNGASPIQIPLTRSDNQNRWISNWAIVEGIGSQGVLKSGVLGDASYDSKGSPQWKILSENHRITFSDMYAGAPEIASGAAFKLSIPLRVTTEELMEIPICLIKVPVCFKAQHSSDFVFVEVFFSPNGCCGK